VPHQKHAEQKHNINIGNKSFENVWNKSCNLGKKKLKIDQFRKCLLQFSSKSVTFPFYNQKFKDQHIKLPYQHIKLNLLFCVTQLAHSANIIYHSLMYILFCSAEALGINLNTFQMLSLLSTAVQRLHDTTVQTTSTNTPITVHYKSISCKYEVLFVYNPLITQ
jgi:hypothetical protein